MRPRNRAPERMILAAFAMISLSLFTGIRAADAAVSVAGKTGEQTVKFDQRSPLSALKTLAPRLSEKKLEPDYDLAAQEFIMWVADDYKSSTPQGIIVLLNYKDTNDLPESILPLLKQRRLIFIALKQVALATYVKVGLVLDAVHNLKKLYAIDENRVYLFDFDRSADAHPENNRGSAGQHLATAFPDVITGSYHRDIFRAWRPLRTPKNTNYPPHSVMPPPAQLGLARTHPVVMSNNGTSEDEYRLLCEKFVKQDGFRLTKRVNVTIEQAHYPNYTTDWVTEVLTYLDDNAPKPKAKPAAPGTAPATPGVRPPVAPPAKPATPVPAKPPAK